MKILIVGSGGREHALAWKLNQSPQNVKLFCAPGNGGIADLAECVDIAADDVEGLVKFAKTNKIDMTVVGPEVALVAGIVDAFEEHGLKAFGPNREAAQLEGSKIFAKEFMRRCNIPTAGFRVFDEYGEAKTYLNDATFPLVIKADGLAAGKGVIICQDLKQADEALDQIMKDKVFAEAGNRVLIEECLEGEEVSILAISDGENYVILDTSQDHKRIFDDDLGPNTGGMGAYSPAPIVDQDLFKQIDARVIEPVIRGMKREGTPFKGVLYAGLMITSQGPMVLEFNVRFGDPEAQVVLPRLKNDLVELMFSCCEGQLNDTMLSWDSRECVCVVMVSGGYPGEYKKNCPITGLEDAAKEKDVLVFHAGTKKDGDKIVTSGGRVLGITAVGDGIEKAIQSAYQAVEKIKFDKCFFRRDIGIKALIRMNTTRRG